MELKTVYLTQADIVRLVHALDCQRVNLQSSKGPKARQGYKLAMLEQIDLLKERLRVATI